jgi:hypothetical protein
MDFNLELGICYVCPEGFVRGYKIMSCMPGLFPTPRNDAFSADEASDNH